jgi:hypothetical protein
VTINYNEMIYAILSVIVTAVLIPLIRTGGTALVELVKTKINNAKVAAYLDSANDAVMTAVAETMQTFVSELKKTGTWSQASWAEAFSKSKDRAIVIMGTATLEALPDIVGDVQAWLTAKIEAATLAQKNSMPVVLEGVVCNG